MRSNTKAALLAVSLVVSPSATRGDESSVPLADWPALESEALAVGLPTNPLTFVGILPCRLADTRDLTLPPGYGPPALPAGAPRNFTLTGRCGIPAEAAAVSANLTVVNPPGPGFLLIRPADGPNVVVSTLNFIPGETTANGAAIPLGTGGAASFLAGVTSTHLIIDVNGYFVPAVAGAGDVTAVSAGSGLTGGGTSGDLTLAVDTAAIQSRIASACMPGSAIRVVSQSGLVTCEADDNTTYTAGSGLSLAGTTISLSSQGCAAGESWKFNGSTFSCDPDIDTNTTYSAGSGLTLTGTTFSVNTTVQQRVTGVCDSAIRTINADGSVVCGPTILSGRDLTPPLCNTHERITFSSPFSATPSVVLTAQGLPGTNSAPNTFCSVGTISATYFEYCCWGNAPENMSWIAMR